MHSVLHIAHPRTINLPILWSHPSGILDPTLLKLVPVPGPTARLKMGHPRHCGPLPVMLLARRE